MIKIKSIISKILILFIVSFAMHDFLVSQDLNSNMTERIAIKESETKSTDKHMLCEVHQVFHSPMLIVDCNPKIVSFKTSNPEDSINALTIKNKPFIPFIPPKYS